MLAITENAEVTVSEGQDKVFTQIPEYTGAKDLEIEIWTENYGFIFLTFTLGDHVFETRFSDVWDPTGDLRRWLEAICIGVEECAFTIQNEGKDTKFNFRHWGNGKSIFFAGWEKDAMSIVEWINKHQFVKTFYTTYLDFLNPHTFTDTKNWDADLASKFKSKIVEEYLQTDKE